MFVVVGDCWLLFVGVPKLVCVACCARSYYVVRCVLFVVGWLLFVVWCVGDRCLRVVVCCLLVGRCLLFCRLC